MTHPNNPELPKFCRLLGLDPGTKTIGVALSDGMQMIASGVETIQRKKLSHDLVRLRKLVDEHKIGGMVVGYPVNMDGSEGPRCQSVRAFAESLTKELGLPVALWDERMSSMAVERTMLAADLSRQKRAQHIDKLAAGYILQGYLDSRG